MELCVPPEQGHCFRSKGKLLEADGEVWIQLPVGLNKKVCSLNALLVQQNTHCTVSCHRTYSRRTNGFSSIEESNWTKHQIFWCLITLQRDGLSWRLICPNVPHRWWNKEINFYKLFFCCDRVLETAPACHPSTCWVQLMDSVIPTAQTPGIQWFLGPVQWTAVTDSSCSWSWYVLCTF
jgi:hypothetical protein